SLKTRGFQEARVVDGDGSVRGNGGNDFLALRCEDTWLVVPEEKAAQYLAGTRDDRHGEVADDRQMPFRHAVVRRIFSVAGILPYVVGPHDGGAAKGRLEYSRVAWQAEFFECLARRACD